MEHGFKPLLSATFDPSSKHVRWPMLASAKLDGIRCIIIDGITYSRTLKPIPNKHVQACLGRPELEGMDGELIVGSPIAPDVYNVTQSAVMSRDGAPSFTFMVFDDISLVGKPFHERIDKLHHRVVALNRNYPVMVVPHCLVESFEEAKATYNDYVEMGYEGIMFRRLAGEYKYGRSTLKGGDLIKWKPLEDFDAVVVDVFEEMYNGNEAVVDELGHTKRSSHQENKVGKGTLGGLIAKPLAGGPTFKVGIFKGVTKQDLQAWWHDKANLVGKTFKCQKLAIGEKDRPRHPRWIGWRDDAETPDGH